MHPAYAVGIGVVSSSFCSLDYTTNGILVRYQEAQKRRRRVASPLAGLDMSYFQMIFEVISQQMGGGEEWDGDKKKARLDRIKDALKSAKMPTEDKFTEEWITVEKTIFCPAMKDIPSAIQTAYDAYLGIIAIQKEGDRIMPEGMGQMGGFA